jgi:hypothetical protein
MTIIDAIKKKMDMAERYVMQNDVGDNNLEPPATLAMAKERLLATSDAYQVLDELLQFAEGKITDVTAEW